MKRCTFSLLLSIIMLLPLMPVTLAASSVVLSPQTVYVDGVKTTFEVYNINGSNYFKLRDIAMALNTSSVQFSVDYDSVAGMISVVKGAAYVPVGNELKQGGDKASTAVSSSQNIRINGTAMSLAAYNIGGNNFFKLRELSDTLGFNADYDKTKNAVLITSSSPGAVKANPSSILNCLAYTSKASTTGYTGSNSVSVGSLLLMPYASSSTDGDKYKLKLLLQADAAKDIYIKAYCNNSDSETIRFKVTTEEWVYTSKQYTYVIVNVDKVALREYYGLDNNTLHVTATDDSGNSATIYSATISTPGSTSGAGTSSSNDFSLVKGFNGSNIYSTYKYAGGKTYAVQYFLTLNTGSYGGTYKMSFPAGDGTDIRTFTVESNSVYHITYTFPIKDSSTYSYKYSFDITLSGPQSAALSFSDTHPGKMNMGSISVVKM